jgi:polysaccharide pyruvyl transferase WcaK-like protein
MKESSVHKKRKKILITEADVVGNKGAVAMVNCIVREVKKRIADAEFSVTSKYIREGIFQLDGIHALEILYDNEQAFDIPLFKLWIYWLLSKIGIRFGFLLKDKVLQTYFDSALVLSTSGISFIDNYGLIPIYHYSKFLQLAFFSGTKVIKFTQSIGPFESQYNKLVAKLVLPNLKWIFVRGRHSEENLKSIGISRNVIQLPDIAMLLEAHPLDTFKTLRENREGRVIIGISPNTVCMHMDKRNVYMRALVEICEYFLKEDNNAYILLIPHTIEGKSKGVDDDLSICRTIGDHLQYPNNFQIIDTLNYSPEQTKYLISLCDFFIGSRFHALVAALSSGVPSFAIGWHWKYQELMEWFEIQDNLVQVWELEIDALVRKLEKSFTDRDNQRMIMESRLADIKNRARKAIDIVIDELNETS